MPRWIEYVRSNAPKVPGRDQCADWNIVVVDLAEADILRLSGQRKANVSQEVDRHRRASIEAIQGHKPRRPNASASPAYCLVGNPSVCRGQPLGCGTEGTGAGQGEPGAASELPTLSTQRPWAIRVSQQITSPVVGHA